MTDISTFSDEVWQEAKRRAEIIRPLAAQEHCPRPLARAAAQDLGLSERQVYTLIKRCRAGDGALGALVPAVSSGGRGSTRISQDREDLIRDLIYSMYLSPQRLSPAVFIREVRRRCQLSGVKPPSPCTIRRRLNGLSPEERQRRGEWVTPIAPVSGRTPIPRFPLDAVQIDHTKVDIILVDPIDRWPIGRPWLTLAIDLHSRCIAGMLLSLEAPSVTSVGLCLVHVATDKAGWLAERGIKAEWPVVGKPRLISVDNGAEFHSAAFERGCEQHGIAIHWRLPGQPHFGGIIERVTGSLMKLVHELPGTTFSNPTERHGYDSDGAASSGIICRHAAPRAEPHRTSELWITLMRHDAERPAPGTGNVKIDVIARRDDRRLRRRPWDMPAYPLLDPLGDGPVQNTSRFVFEIVDLSIMLRERVPINPFLELLRLPLLLAPFRVGGIVRSIAEEEADPPGTAILSPGGQGAIDLLDGTGRRAWRGCPETTPDDADEEVDPHEIDLAVDDILGVADKVRDHVVFPANQGDTDV